jgi:hypothetical protein
VYNARWRSLFVHIGSHKTVPSSHYLCIQAATFVGLDFTFIVFECLSYLSDLNVQVNGQVCGWPSKYKVRIRRLLDHHHP